MGIVGGGFSRVRKGTLDVDVLRTIRYRIFKYSRVKPKGKFLFIVIFIFP